MSNNREFSSLASRDLYRGHAVDLPSGEAVARAMGEKPCNANELRTAGSELCGGTPLWLYVLHIQEDWSAVLDAPVRFRDTARVGLKVYIFWSRKARAEVADMRKRAIAGRRSFMRMHSFLLSWILLVGGADKIELLTTQLSFWSISRAFAMTLALASVEIPLVWRFWEGSIANPILLLVLFYLPQLVLMLAAFGVSWAAYSRLCGTMFALCYIADKKSAGPPSPPS